MDKIDEIKRLADLLKEGAITKEEFNLLKNNLLNSIDTNINSEIANEKKNTLVISGTNRKDSPTHKKALKENQNINLQSGDSSFANISKKDAVDMLYKMGVGFNHQNLIYYASIDDFNKVELLLIAGLNPNQFFTWTTKEQSVNIYPLHNTAANGSPDMIKLLLKYGANINLKDDKGDTPLFHAIKNGKPELVKALVENGVDFNQRNSKKINPLYYAFSKKKYEIVDLLKKAGAENLSEQEIKSYEGKRLMIKLIVAICIVAFLFMVYSIYNSPSTSTTSSSSNQDGFNHHCTYCGKAYSGAGYFHFMNGCVKDDGNSGDHMCSLRCCQEEWSHDPNNRRAR